MMDKNLSEARQEQPSEPSRNERASGDAEPGFTPRLKLLSVKTHVLRCYSCKRWVGRMPQWDNGELGHGWQCECGNTSTISREGRPFGPRYRYWQELVDEFVDYERLNMLTGEMGKWILGTVTVREKPEFKRRTSQWEHWGD